MAGNINVRFADLLDAFEFASAGDTMENAAYVSLETGVFYCVTSLDDLDSDLPDDLDDASRYASLPHKHDLGLGTRLVFDFSRQTLSHDQDVVDGFFRQRGGYRKFKDFLARKGLEEQWYAFEARATAQALREWADENGFQVTE